MADAEAVSREGLGSIKLKSSDGSEFTVDRETLSMSSLIRDLVEDSDAADDCITLDNVKADILSKVIEYCKYHQGNLPKEIPRPLPTSKLASVVSHWDAEFIDLDYVTIFELMRAANYMDIQPLLDLACAKIASELKDKDPEEIRQKFGIVNDFTPAEEKQVREENRWCEEAA